MVANALFSSLHAQVFTGLGRDLGGQTQLLQSLPASKSFPVSPLSSRFNLNQSSSNLKFEMICRQEVTDSLCIHGVATLEREPNSPAQVLLTKTSFRISLGDNVPMLVRQANFQPNTKVSQQ